MSPYLHFGQISPLFIALEALKKGPGPGLDAFLEELIVRRELSHNFVHYNPRYDQYEGLADWARTTLELHAEDPRDYVYSLEEFEQARTHDPYWNAAQLELIHTGTMHGYMRMYWGKKILEWTEHPQQGFDIALYLNNKYQLDGRDPNGFAGVAWCFGQHDRAWGERPFSARCVHERKRAEAKIQDRRLRRKSGKAGPPRRTDPVPYHTGVRSGVLATFGSVAWTPSFTSSRPKNRSMVHSRATRRRRPQPGIFSR